MDLREMVFRLRGYTPIPFLIISIVWAKPTMITLGIGAALCLLGETLRINALRHAGGATRTRNVGAPELVSSGPYAHVRNPLYVANMVLYTGFALASGAFMPYLSALIVLYFGWQYGMIISLEEGTLRNIFGEAYQRYCETVPRLLPKLKPGSSSRKPAPFKLSEALREERSTLMGLAFAWLILALRVLFLPALP